MTGEMKMKSLIKYAMLVSLCIATYTTNASQAPDDITYGKYEKLQTNNKKLFTVYTAGPETAKQGVLLIHGWWGLNKEVESRADKLGLAGYRVMAIDLFDNKVTKHPETAKKFLKAMVQAEANEKYLAAMNMLTANGRKIVVIGHSYGAAQALEATLAVPGKVSATIMYYPFGEMVSDMDKLKTIKTPFMAHLAEHDFFLTKDKREKFTALMKNAGIDMSVNIYNAKHGFAAKTAPNYDEVAYTTSWQKSRDFINQHTN
jgi:dienelactone hydrolase